MHGKHHREFLLTADSQHTENGRQVRRPFSCTPHGTIVNDMTTRPSWESAFEAFLWGSRLVVLVAVLASLVASLAMFYVATVDVVTLLGYVVQYHQPLAHAAARATLRGTIIAYVVEVVD